MMTGTHIDAATTGAIGLDDARTAVNKAGCWEVWAMDMLHQAIDIEIRIIKQGQHAIDHFAHIMRRNVRRHANSDAAGAID